MQYSSAGVGSGTHLPCALFNYRLGLDITMVPYKGEGPALLDVIAGRMDYMCATIQSGAAQAKQGAVKGIAVMAPRRRGRHSRSGDDGRAGDQWCRRHRLERLPLPEGHAEADRRQLNKAVREMLSREDVRKKLESMGLEIVPAEQQLAGYMAKFLKEDIERWGNVIKAAGISVN